MFCFQIESLEMESHFCAYKGAMMKMNVRQHNDEDVCNGTMIDLCEGAMMKMIVMEQQQ